ncbi:MAG: hypothetical protein GWN14_13615 [candidate division Zixibacteria bacterium]|nr:hypothetical protein [Phycisphaerae bacterium]NIW42179.1 hypothetical protein [candidate division Zixibacteria bacterium]NIX30054.1 hypothetical protein [Phycisphaerae bacterium]NIX56921.1 hypothetical protein [candidate division Zixibacteria bacterium]
MQSRLKQAGLWNSNDDIEINISLAWELLSRIGLPGRYGGKAPDGSYEFIIIDPTTGAYLTTGKGQTLELSICEAALNAKVLTTLPGHQH